VEFVLNLADRDLSQLHQGSTEIPIGDMSQNRMSAREPDLEADPLVQFPAFAYRNAEVDLFGFPMLEMPVHRRERGNDFAAIVLSESGSEA